MSVDLIGASGVNKLEISASNAAYVTMPVSITAINITANGTSNQATCGGYTGIGVQLTSLGTGGTIQFEGSGDANNWAPMVGVPNPSGPAVTSTVSAGAWQFDGTGVPYFRCRASALTSGNITGAIILTPTGSIVSDQTGTYNTMAGNEYCMPVRNIPMSSTITVSSNAAANTALTVTLPAVAGSWHYITGIEIYRINASNAAVAGTAALNITTTNLIGARQWFVGNALAAGVHSIDVSITRNCAIKSNAANTATTIVMPAPGTGVRWACNVDYFIGT